MSLVSSLHLRNGVFAASLVFASVGSAGAAAVIERPASSRPGIAVRPGYDFAQTLNALVAAQLAAQNRPDQANPYRVPRPRPDREQLIPPDKAGG